MKRFGLIGEKLSHSFSPQIHKIILKAMGIESTYDLCEIPMGQLKQCYPKVIQNYNGCNVTIPYKKDVIELLDSMDDISNAIGAVNTIKITENEATGYNTDYFGFGVTLDKFEIPTKNKKAYIIGTGGASKAVYHYLKNHEIKEIIFINRKKDTHWAKDSKILTFDECKSENGDIIINCTPLGMGSYVNQTPIEMDILENFNYAVDLIYNPKETIFLKNARELGLKSINGLYMLVGQAVKSEEIWNNMTLDEHIIDQIYQEIEKIIYE